MPFFPNAASYSFSCARTSRIRKTRACATRTVITRPVTRRSYSTECAQTLTSWCTTGSFIPTTNTTRWRWNLACLVPTLCTRFDIGYCKRSRCLPWPNSTWRPGRSRLTASSWPSSAFSTWTRVSTTYTRWWVYKRRTRCRLAPPPPLTTGWWNVTPNTSRRSCVRPLKNQNTFGYELYFQRKFQNLF